MARPLATRTLRRLGPDRIFISITALKMLYTCQRVVECFRALEAAMNLQSLRLLAGMERPSSEAFGAEWLATCRTDRRKRLVRIEMADGFDGLELLKLVASGAEVYVRDHGSCHITRTLPLPCVDIVEEVHRGYVAFQALSAPGFLSGFSCVP